MCGKGKTRYSNNSSAVGFPNYLFVRLQTVNIQNQCIPEPGSKITLYPHCIPCTRNQTVSKIISFRSVEQ